MWARVRLQADELQVCSCVSVSLRPESAASRQGEGITGGKESRTGYIHVPVLSTVL